MSVSVRPGARFSVKRLAAVAGMILIYLIVFDVGVVAISFVLDVVPVRHKSNALFYTIWLVAGVFCGFIIYYTGGAMLSADGKGEWMERADGGTAGLFVILALFLVLAGLSVLSYLTLWREGANSSYYVPDNAALTLSFFATVLASAALAHKLFQPAALRT